MMRSRIWRSTPPGLERCCFGSLGIFGVFGLRAGCLSAFGTSPLRGSLGCVAFFPLQLSESDRVVDEFLLVADDDDDDEDDEDEDVDDEEEEAAAEPPCKVALVAFLATLGSGVCVWCCWGMR